jgi:hypothetical protein
MQKPKKEGSAQSGQRARRRVDEHNELEMIQTGRVAAGFAGITAGKAGSGWAHFGGAHFRTLFLGRTSQIVLYLPRRQPV